MAVGTQASVRGYRFGPFEYLSGTNRLTKSGVRIRVERKPLLVLQALLERPREVVSREELQRRLWPGDTFVDFELGLRVAVNKLRDALGDSHDAPRYIETIQGEGYRFVAAVEPLLEDAPQLPQPAPAGVAVAPPAQPYSAFARLSLGILIASTLGILALLWIVSRKPALAFHSGDWLLIAAIENRTGEAVFDDTIEYGLEREIGQSRFISIAPRVRIDDALALMRLPAKTTLTEDLARQVALRDGGIRGVVAGRIEKFDQNYVLTLRLLEPASGNVSAIFVHRGSKSEVVNGLAEAADELRRNLGETPPPNREELEKATTTSLDALRAFSRGMAIIRPALAGGDVDWRAAAGMFVAAVQQDPNFALACIFAAHSYSNLDDNAQAASYYEQAFRLAPQASERERLFILGSYYQRYKPDMLDMLQARRAYEALVTLYPDDAWGVNNLAHLYRWQRPTPDLVRMLERMVSLQPNSVALHQRLYVLYRDVLPNGTLAAKHRRELVRLGASPLAPTPFDWIEERALLAWRVGDVQRAVDEIRLLEGVLGRPEPPWWDAYTLSPRQLMLGKLRRGRELCEQVREADQRSSCIGRVAFAAHNERLLVQSSDEFVRAEQKFASETAEVELMMLARRGHTAQVEALLKRVPRELLPALAGWLDFSRGHYADAAEKLTTTYRPIGETFLQRAGYYFNVDGLAVALAKTGRAAQAVAMLQRDTQPGDVRVLDAFSWLECRATLAHLLRQQRRPEEAQKVEAELRHYLSQADPDHPLLVELNRLK